MLSGIVSPSALAVLRLIDAALKPRYLYVVGILRDVDDRLVAAGVVVAVGNPVLHALPAHVGEIHRRAGRMVGLHLFNPRAQLSVENL
jgi:hypothetical protein